MELFKLICQLAIGIGILNVWLVRFNVQTRYRGGSATNMKDEFSIYGLPEKLVWVTGTIKIGTAIALLAGIAFPSLITPAATVLAVFMLSAVLFHVKVKDPLFKSIPATTVLLLTLVLLLF